MSGTTLPLRAVPTRRYNGTIGAIFSHYSTKITNNPVTPLVGVWIETFGLYFCGITLQSLPSWECGLKRKISNQKGVLLCVTPLGGVWIETLCYSRSR